MSQFHTLIFVGNVGKDPEMKYLDNGTAVTSFNVGVTPMGNKDKQCWYRVTTFGSVAEACATHVKKGMLVLVEGSLTPGKGTGEPRVWTDKSGNARSSYDVTAQTVQFLSRVDGVSDVGTETRGKDASAYFATDGDDVPF